MKCDHSNRPPEPGSTVAVTTLQEASYFSPSNLFMWSLDISTWFHYRWRQESSFHGHHLRRRYVSQLPSIEAKYGNTTRDWRRGVYGLMNGPETDGNLMVISKEMASSGFDAHLPLGNT